MQSDQSRTMRQDTATLNRIRVETALSRFPIHKLARRGVISIDMLRLTEEGHTDYQWKVSYNSKYGQPGPLAYKLDTLIINRLLDEAKRPLPEFLKLGSLSDICRQLSLSESGVNRKHIKTALLQNASAFIEANIECRQRDGTMSTLEIGDTRYGIILTGKRLPDGSRADAVYITLHPWFRDLQNRVELRPLDYDYLKALPEAPQRLYELLSFPMYGALANGRPRARLRYSEFCTFAPVTRYHEYDPVKKQMSKIHRPHRESGYIDRTDFEATVDDRGQPDWEMLYTPGPKARAEFIAFTRKSAPLLAPPVRPISAPLPVQATLDLAVGPVDERLLDALTRRGITPKKAQDLLATLKPGQYVEDQLEYVDYIIAQAPRGKFRNPSGFYVRFIEGNAPIPEDFQTSRKLRRSREIELAQDEEASQLARLQVEYEEYQRSEVERYIGESLSEEEKQQILARLRKQVKAQYRQMTALQLEGLAQSMLAGEVKGSGRVELLSLSKFREKERKQESNIAI